MEHVLDSVGEIENMCSQGSKRGLRVGGRVGTAVGRGMGGECVSAMWPYEDVLIRRKKDKSLVLFS